MTTQPVRLRTLLLLRWVAILGQLVALGVAVFIGLQFDWLVVLLVIAVSAVLNLALSWRGWQPDDWHVTVQLALDVAQVSVLLALTGGLSNPFALIILAPVTIAATALDRNNVMFLCLATISMISLASMMAVPLRDQAGRLLAMPHLLEIGHWFAIVIGVGFFAGYSHRVSSELRARATALSATEMALAREQKLQHLDGVVAAAAHEMGTPLATIKLVSSELADELGDRPELAEDLALLRQSADRCRDILRSMGRAGKDDMLLRAAPLSALLDEAAGPHAARGNLEVRSLSGDGSAEPIMRRDPGLVHGLRNLVQNAVDFAADTVRIDAVWTRQRVVVTIRDDGPGFPPAMLARIGEPFLTTRRIVEGAADDRPGYEGMGLGLFIAKTLLERSGAALAFRNGGSGAVVEIAWSRTTVESQSRGRGPLGDNPVIVA